MPGMLLHVGASATCPHGGQVSIVSSNSRVTVSQQAVALANDQFTIAGCSFTVPPNKPQPCMTVQWLEPATRVTVTGQPVILQSSTGLCQSADQIPAGPPNVTTTQTRVKGT